MGAKLHVEVCDLEVGDLSLLRKMLCAHIITFLLHNNVYQAIPIISDYTKGMETIKIVRRTMPSSYWPFSDDNASWNVGKQRQVGHCRLC